MVEEEREREGRGLGKTLRMALQVFFGLIALVAVIFLLNRIGWAVIGNTLLRVGPWGVLILAALGFMENLFDSAALRAAMPERIGLFRILAYNGAGAIINSVIYGEAGEVVKGALLRRHTSTRDAISSTVVWNYIFKFSRPSAALTVALIGLLLGADLDPMISATVITAAIIAFLPYFILFVLIRRGMAELLVNTLSFVKIIRKDPEKLIEEAGRLDRQIQDFRKERPWDYLRVFGYQFLARITAWFALFAAVRLIGLDYSLGLSAMIYAGFSVASYIAMLIPARLGVSEGVGYVIFSLYGLDAGMGLVVYIVLRIKALVTNGIPAILRP